MSLEFPNIDPVALALGPVQIRWYALAYVTGILLGWVYIKKLLNLYPEDQRPSKDHIDDFMSWAIVGVILGGRLGYILFYNLPQYLSNPIKILYVWEGGMAFHGGLIGVVLAVILFSMKHKLNVLRFGDLICCAAPIGILFGRVTNFINGELYGRVADVPWGMIFPHAGELPRHPSQLYEAGLEGAFLFLVLFVCTRFRAIRDKAGMLSVIFIAGYALSRMFVELFREPDAHIGFLSFGLTMGQILSIAMVAGAVVLLAVVAYSHKKQRNNDT